MDDTRWNDLNYMRGGSSRGRRDLDRARDDVFTVELGRERITTLSRDLKVSSTRRRTQRKSNKEELTDNGHCESIQEDIMSVNCLHDVACPALLSRPRFALSRRKKNVCQ